MGNDRTMTIQDIKNLPDEELYNLSLQKRPNGNATWEANIAYMERQRRSGSQGNLGRGAKCSKYQADIDYYGGSEYSNR